MNQQIQEHPLKEQIKAEITQAALEIKQNDNPLQVLADTLMDYFTDSEAINFIEQRFSDVENPERNFVITMQLAKGLTPAAKLADSEDRNLELSEALTESNQSLQQLCDIVENLGGDLKNDSIKSALALIASNTALIKNQANK